MTTRKSVDWDAIEPDFRAGTKSIRQIAKENSITHGAVNQHAKLHGWTRDLTAKVRQATRSKLTADALSTPLSADSGVDTEKDAEIVDANAELRANIVRDHRGDIRAARALTKRMLAELQQQSGSPETLEAFAEIVATTVKDGERKTDEKSLAAFKKALGLGNRAQILEGLARSLRTLVTLERQAFSLDDEESEFKELTYEQRLGLLGERMKEDAARAGMDIPPDDLQDGVPETESDRVH